MSGNFSDKKCDTSKPFVFISYAHKGNLNKSIVSYAFRYLSEGCGCNIWIDYANIEEKDRGWYLTVRKLISSENCIRIILFRNEFSMINNNVCKELEIAVKMNVPVLVIDTWQFTDGLNTFRTLLLSNASPRTLQVFENFSRIFDRCAMERKDNSERKYPFLIKYSEIVLPFALSLSDFAKPFHEVKAKMRNQETISDEDAVDGLIKMWKYLIEVDVIIELDPQKGIYVLRDDFPKLKEYVWKETDHSISPMSDDHSDWELMILEMSGHSVNQNQTTMHFTALSDINDCLVHCGWERLSERNMEMILRGTDNVFERLSSGVW